MGRIPYDTRRIDGIRALRQKGGKRMTRGTGELEFLQAFVQRGFVNIPRILFDYMPDLGLDYDTVGKLYALLAFVGGVTENTFGPYVISRRVNPHDFDQARALVLDLEEREIALVEDQGERVIFSLVPLFARLRATWSEYREGYEEELSAGSEADPVLLAAEKLLGRPLSDREAADIQDWTTTYNFGVDMVQAVIRQGQSRGVTRMGYLNGIARQWFEEGIRTPEEAEAHNQRYRKAAGKHKAIMQYLGVQRQLTAAEQALLDKWTDEWGFSNEVIIRACADAVGAKNPLQYVNRMLEKWQEQGVRSVADADRLDAQRRTGTDEQKQPVRKTRPPARGSNVFLQREKKDDSYYDHIFKRFDK